MAFAVTLKASGEADLNTSPHVVSEALSAITFAADSLVLVVLGATKGDDTLAAPPLTCSAAGLAFSPVADGFADSPFQAVARALTADHSAGGSTTITVSSDGENCLGIFYAVYEVTGHDTGGPIGATAGNADSTTDGSRTLTLDAAPAASSIVIAGITADTNAGTNVVTAGTGWTEDAMVDSVGGSNFGLLQTQRRTGSTSTGVVWDDVRPAGSEEVFSTGAVAVEVVQGAAGITETVAQATETDTAQPISVAKIKTLGQATETDTAQLVTSAKAKEVGQTTEAGTAQPVTSSKGYTLGQADSTETAQPITARKTYSVGQASETDTAFAVTAADATPVGLATETDQALPVTVIKAYTLGLAVETDTALALVTGEAPTTPASRIFTVQAEDRTFSIRAEDRTFEVAAESRRFAVT